MDTPYDDDDLRHIEVVSNDAKRGKVKVTAHARWRPSWADEDHDFWFFIRHAELEFWSSGLGDPNGPMLPRGGLPIPTPQELTLTVRGIADVEKTEQLSLVIGQCEGWRMEALIYAVEAFQQGHHEHAMEVGHLALTAARDGEASKLARARLMTLQHLGLIPR